MRKERQERTKRILHTDFCQDQLAGKAVNNPRCANPHIPGDLTRGTAALRSSQGSPFLSGFPCCRIWQWCHKPLVWAALLTPGDAAVTLGRSLKPGQSRETGHGAPPTQPCFTEGRCIQLLATCITHVLPGHCSRVVEMQAVAPAHLEQC